MSNPLAAFRKYQKAMLAVAAGGAMLAFGILPVMQQGLDGSQNGGGGGSVDNPVRVSWKGGNLRESDLQNEMGRRQQLANFQQAVVMTASQRGAQPRLMVIPPANESSVVESLLLAQKAEEAGIRVSDEAVIQHLEGQLANGTMTGNELAKLLQNTSNGRMSQQQLIDGFKMEMAAHRMRVLAGGGAFTGSALDNAATPVQAFEFFKRLNRRMEAEVLEIPAEEYLDQVKSEPSDAEVKELYNEFKSRFPDPSRADPGFRVPTRIAFAWLKADFPQLLQREISKLSEEELRKYYEDNKEGYKKLTLPTDEESGKDAADDDATDDDATDGDAEGADEVAAEDAENQSSTSEEPAAEEFQSFEEVRSDIATLLARPKATDAVRDATTQAIDEMKKFYEDYEFWKATGEEGSDPPKQPSLTEMASNLGLISGELPLVSPLETQDYALGKAFDIDFNPRTNQPVRISFPQMAFQPSVGVFSPQQINDAENPDSVYIFWKTEQKDQYIPELDEAKPAVVRHWKMKEALKLAKAQGEQWAKQLRDSKQSLKTMFETDAAKSVADTGEFTWMGYGATFSGAGAPRLSSVEGVEYAGETFMADVSKLASGECTVTTNQPEAKAYVVYVKGVTSSEEELRQLFMKDAQNIGVRLIAAGTEGRIYGDWMEGLQDQMAFEVNERTE